MGTVATGLDHPDTIPRILRAFRAGLDTVAIAAFTRVPEPEVYRILAEERETARRNRGRTGWGRLAAISRAWAADDIDQQAVARRFGFASASAVRSAFTTYRRHLAAHEVRS